MDQYRTWLAGLKRALLHRDDQTLHSAINIAATILIGIPEGFRSSTFVGQPGLLETLSKLQRALNLGSGRHTDQLKTALVNQIRLWELTKSISTPTAPPVSLPLSPSPPPSESSYRSAEAVDLATRQTRVFPLSRSDAGGRYQGILAPVPVFNGANAHDLPLATFLPQRSGPVPGEGFGAHCEICSKRNGVCVQDQGASCVECLPFRNAAGSAAKAKNNNRDSSENPAAEMKKYNADQYNRMGQEDGRLTQIFTDQQLLAAKYQELVDLLQERDDEWTRKLAQDTCWRIGVDRKLQTILHLLSRSLRIGPLQSVAGDNPRSYFGPD